MIIGFFEEEKNINIGNYLLPMKILVGVEPLSITFTKLNFVLQMLNKHHLIYLEKSSYVVTDSTQLFV